MSLEESISVSGLSKCYLIYNRPQDRLWQGFWRGRKTFYREFWALKALSFVVRKGESVGIIGRNGSGKSTLLQLIAGTLTPTTGSVAVNGRIAALLELGSGFNPEFTGRENVFMNGAILGMGRQEIVERYHEISSFADIGEFIDQPVKSYSSGMVVRLAFAVAVCVEPEILIVDEALAVGDELFQRKCFDRIRQIKNRGATILFVSHSASSVVDLCDRAILLDHGERLLDDIPKTVVSSYHSLIFAPPDRRNSVREALSAISKATTSGTEHFPKIDTSPLPQSSFDPGLIPQSTLAYESAGAMIHDVQIQDSKGNQVNLLISGESYDYVYLVDAYATFFSVRFGMLIKTTNGTELGGATSALPGNEMAILEKGDSIEVRFRFRCLLQPGVYFLNAGCDGLGNGERIYLHRISDAAAFRVQNTGRSISVGPVNFLIESSTFVSHSSNGSA